MAERIGENTQTRWIVSILTAFSIYPPIEQSQPVMDFWESESGQSYSLFSRLCILAVPIRKSASSLSEMSWIWRLQTNLSALEDGVYQNVSSLHGPCILPLAKCFGNVLEVVSLAKAVLPAFSPQWTTPLMPTTA
jgi:hypothetical protein